MINESVGVGKVALGFGTDSEKSGRRVSPIIFGDVRPTTRSTARRDMVGQVRRTWGTPSISFSIPSGFYDSVPPLSDFLGYDWDDLTGEMEMKVFVFALLGVLSIALYSQQSQPTRVGMIIGIKPDKISAYEALHAASNQGVRDLLDKYHMHNFSIYIQKMDETHYYLFAYYEYTGNNYKQDMDTLAKEPRNIAWLSKTDAMQIPFAGEKSWTKMQEIFHNP